MEDINYEALCEQIEEEIEWQRKEWAEDAFGNYPESNLNEEV